MLLLVHRRLLLYNPFLALCEILAKHTNMKICVAVPALLAAAVTMVFKLHIFDMRSCLTRIPWLPADFDGKLKVEKWYYQIIKGEVLLPLLFDSNFFKFNTRIRQMHGCRCR